MGTKNNIYLPQSARPKQADSEISREQAAMAQELFEVTGKLKHFNDELSQIDEWLSVVLAKPNTTVEGLKPSYYHLVRRRPGHPAYVKVVEGPNGEWRDLDSSVFDLAAEDDLWNDRSQRELRQKARRSEEARQRQSDREAQDRAHEFDARLKSSLNGSISVTRSIT